MQVVQANCHQCGIVRLSPWAITLINSHRISFDCPRCGDERVQQVPLVLAEALRKAGAKYVYPQFTLDDIIELMEEIEEQYGSVH